MSAASISQLVGIIAVALMSVAFAAIAWEEKRFSRFGREALTAGAGFLIATAGVRLSVLFGWLTTDEARFVNGVIAVVFFVIAAQTMYLQHVEIKSKHAARIRRISGRARAFDRSSVRH